MNESHWMHENSRVKIVEFNGFDWLEAKILIPDEAGGEFILTFDGQISSTSFESLEDLVDTISEILGNIVEDGLG